MLSVGVTFEGNVNYHTQGSVYDSNRTHNSSKISATLVGVACSCAVVGGFGNTGKITRDTASDLIFIALEMIKV